MKRKSLLFLLLFALFAPWAAKAQQTLTVYDQGGTTTNQYVPIYGYYADYGCRSQFIIPASKLEDVQGGTIEKLTFYLNSSVTLDETFTVYLKEVDYTTFSSATLEDWDGMTAVYTNTVTVNSDKEMEIDFSSTSFSYGGDNLMIGFQVTTNGSSSPYTYWYGENQTSSSYTAVYNTANSSHIWNSSVFRIAFIPKTTITYTPSSTTATAPGVTTNSTPTNLTNTSVTLGGTITDMGGATGVFAGICYSTSSTPTTADGEVHSRYTSAAAYTKDITGLLPNTTYYYRAFAYNTANSLDDPTYGDIYSFTTGGNITLNQPANGEISVSVAGGTATTTNTYALPGQSVTLTATVVDGYSFDSWIVSGVTGTANGQTYTFTMPSNNVTVTASIVPTSGGSSSETYYELATSIESGEKYLIVRGNQATVSASTTFFAMERNNTSSSSGTLDYGTPTFKDSQKHQISGITPHTSGHALSDFEWTINASGSDYTISAENGGSTYYLIETSSSDGNLHSYTTSNSNYNANYINWTIYTSSNDGFLIHNSYWHEQSTSTYYYLYYSSGFKNYYVSTTPQYQTSPNYRMYLYKLTSTTTYAITATASPAEGGTVAGSDYYANGSTCTLTATPAFGYDFVSWTEGGTVVSTDAAYTFTVSSARTLVANFESQGSCIKPTDVAQVANTEAAHQAQLSWTENNEATQWQVVYSTDSEFDPDAATPVTVNENPATITGLNQAATYYIYVRTICDQNSHSGWSNKASFTTISGCQAPTVVSYDPSTLTANEVTITWTGVATNVLHQSYDLYYSTDPVMPQTPVQPSFIGGITGNSYPLTELTDNTEYYVWVRDNCGTDGYSDWSNSISFTTLQTAVNLPYSNDFESTNGWMFVNGNLSNAWTYGEATNNGGTHALYVSNDGGTTYAYNNGSEAMVYATKLFNFEAGTYVFSYDWKANGESTYDYLRVALVPSSVQLAAATSVPSGFGTAALPTGWIALDGGEKLNLKSGWQSFATDEMEIAAGTYMMVFAWRNDGNGGSNPPAAIDNVSIVKITCTTPTNLDAPQSGITATSAQLSWTETGTATAWQIELTDENDNVDVIDVDEDDLVDGVYTIEDLTSESIYAARVRANCGDGYSNYCEEIIFETAEDCQTPDGLAATATSNSAEISWNGYGQVEFNLRYSTDGETWTTKSEVGNPYMLSPLAPATTYYVQVQPTCADAETWSVSYSFTTECEAQTITVATPFTEGFEGITGTHTYTETNGIIPTCWDSYSEGSVYPHIITSGSYYYHHEGTGTMYFKGEANTNSYLALPIFTNDLSTLIVSFWMATESSSSGTLSLGYITDADVDYNSYQVIKTYNNTTTNTSMVQCQTFVGSNTIPSNATRLVFRWQYNGNSWYGACIDDVKVEIAPTFTKEIVAHDSQSPQDGGTGWYLIASPVGDIAPADVENMISQTADNYDLYRFNQAPTEDEGKYLEWENYKTHTTDFTTLVSGQGYLYANAQTVTLKFTGAPYSGDSKEVPLTYSEDNDDEHMYGWNLIGNPYGTNANLDLPYYRMNDDRSALKTNIETTPVALMEGVFVYAFDETNNAPITLATFTPATRSATMPQSIVNVNVVSGRGSVIDNAIIRFDGGLTLPKFQLNPNHTKVYIPQDGKDYAVVGAGNVGELPVNFKAENNGSYTLSFTAEEVAFSYLHLIDNMTGKDIDLLQAPSYSFNATTNDYESRFRLVFATGSSIDGESFGFFNGNGNFSIIGIEGTATLQVIDVMGRMLSSETFNGSIETKISDVPGVYMLRLVNGNEVRTQKVIVK